MRPSRVPDQIIESLKEREDAQGILAVDELALFEKGEPVVIQKGSFKGQIAVVEKMTDQQRVELLLDLLGGKTKVTFSINEIASL